MPKEETSSCVARGKELTHIMYTARKKDKMPIHLCEVFETYETWIIEFSVLPNKVIFPWHPAKELRIISPILPSVSLVSTRSVVRKALS